MATNESMQGAALNVQACATMHNNNDDDKGSENDDDDNNIDAVEDVVQQEDIVVNCDVSLDEACQRRGYSSLNGFVSAIERVNDKVVDAEVMTKSCRACTIWKNKQADPGYANWKLTHDCPINQKGSSTSMESECAVKIFNRSIDRYNLRYVNYIGDVDSSSFSKVVDSNPYPGTKVNKLECVGHIQKRVGANSIKLTQENSLIKGKREGRLTKKVINTLQYHFGMAIRNCQETNVMKMKMAIAAVLCNCVRKVDGNGKEDKPERRKYCPKDMDTWC